MLRYRYHLLRSSLVFISKIELSFDPEFCPMVFYLTFVLFKIILFQFSYQYVNYRITFIVKIFEMH